MAAGIVDAVSSTGEDWRHPGAANACALQGSSNISTVGGGACAFTAGSGSADTPRCVRIPLVTVGSSRNAMTFIGPSQREQTITSTHRGTLRAPAKTRFHKAAQSRRYADRGCDGFGDGDGDGVEDANCVDGTGAEPVDGHRVGGASTGGGGTTFARRRLVGAKTP